MTRTTIPQLDTLRVFAMLAIFLHHLWKTVIPAPETIAQKALDPFLTTASDGVIIFNIISGFLLAMPYLGLEYRPLMGYRHFLQKRFLRIIPPYYLALFLFTLGNMLRFDNPLLSALDLLAQHLFFVNSLNYSNMYTNFSHFWYLGLLAQFYLFFPFILGLFVRMGATRAAVAIITLCWGSWIVLAWFFPGNPQPPPDFAENLMHFNLPGRLPEFIIGMWLASIWNPSADSVRRSIFNQPFALLTGAMALYLILGAAFYSGMNLPLIHIYHVALSLIFFLILYAWNWAAKAGESPMMKDFSAHSYTIYIVHHPLFSYVGVMPSTVDHTVGNFVVLTALLLPLCFFGARIIDSLSNAIIKVFKRGNDAADY